MKSSTALCLILLLTTIVFIPGLTGGFLFDDYANILQNQALSDASVDPSTLVQSAWSGGAGPLKRPIAMLSFALNQIATGSWPMAYKITNLLIHLLNGVLAYFAAVLIFRALGAEKTLEDTANNLALVVAAVWLLHPINLTPVLYVVQRMTSLAALFSFAAVITYCAGRERLIKNQRDGWLMIYIVTPTMLLLGALCKENALLVVPVLAVIEICAYQFRTASPRSKLILKTATFGVNVIPALAVLAFLFLIRPEWLNNAFDGRPFTLAERMLTESRVLWFYLSLILLPRLNEFALYHDDFALSTHLLEPTSTLFASVGIGLIVLFALSNYRRLPLLCIAVSWFLLGHIMESSIFPLELIHEHRNYFPSFGVIFGIVYALYAFMRKRAMEKSVRAISIVVICLLAGLTFLRASDWSDPVTLAVTEAHNHPKSHRSVYAAARIYYGLYLMRGDETSYSQAMQLLEQSGSLDPSAKRPYFGLIRLSHIRGKEPPQYWSDELRRRLQYTLFHHADWMDLHLLVKCHATDPECPIPVNDVLEFYAAALANETVAPYTKAQMLLDLAVFYVNEMKEYEPAIALLDDAVLFRPNEFQFRATRIEVLLLAGALDRAEQAIKELQTRTTSWDDYFESPKSQIDALTASLAERRESLGH